MDRTEETGFSGAQHAHQDDTCCPRSDRVLSQLNGKQPVTDTSRLLLIQLACSLALILPSLLLLWYIRAFGVSVIFWDEWEMIPLLQKELLGTLTFSDLFAQHNEHRIFFPRIAMLTMARLTQYNTIAEMLLSWLLICMTALLVFRVFQKESPSSGRARFLLAFLPVSILLFGFRQFESILWGFTCQIYLMIFGAVATFFLLESSRKIDVRFMCAFFAATLSSFSFLTGLMVWPIGLFQIVVSERRKKVGKTTLWCLAALVIFASYLYGYVKPGQHPSLEYVLTDPFLAGTYFLTFIGAPLSWDSARGGAPAFGLLISVIALFAFASAHRSKVLRRNAIWLSFIFFGAASALAATVGRSGFGPEQALSSRYTPITAIGIVGLYLFLLSLPNSAHRGRNFAIDALLTIILVGTILSVPGGLLVGEMTRNSREMGAYVLMGYRTQSDENIRYLYPHPAIVRERAIFLEQNRLNVFSDPSINASLLFQTSLVILLAAAIGLVLLVCRSKVGHAQEGC